MDFKNLNSKDIIKLLFGTQLTANMFIGKYPLQDIPLKEAILFLMVIFLTWIIYEGLEWYIINISKPYLHKRFELREYEKLKKIEYEKLIIDKKLKEEYESKGVVLPININEPIN